jgi:anti-sigma regulatory factor (Ser/Thr protein kinase)
LTVRAQIRESLDVFAARRMAKKLAAAIGFKATVCTEIAIVVSELATNIVKYGIRGEIVLGKTEAPLAPGIEVIALDEGPPLADLSLAIRDGFGDRGPIDPDRWIGRGGIGAGLGAVIRLSDAFEYHPGPGRKFFRALRYLHLQQRVVRV